MTYFTTPQFWHLYNALPREVRHLADKNFALLKSDPGHSSLRLKKAGKYWSARVGAHALWHERTIGRGSLMYYITFELTGE